jgi:hypothetical protein
MSIEQPPRKFRSATIYEGTIRATTRSFLHALGQDEEDIARHARRIVRLRDGLIESDAAVS